MKTLVGVIIVLAVLGGGFFLLAPGTPEGGERAVDENRSTSIPTEDVAQEAAGEATLIRYTDNGFEPASIEVTQGVTVTFKNDSSRAMWPASAKHPTHTVYSGTSLAEHCGGGAASSFDSCTALGSGAAYSFTFDKAGEWAYHNHVNAQHVGKITVK